MFGQKILDFRYIFHINCKQNIQLWNRTVINAVSNGLSPSFIHYQIDGSLFPVIYIA